MHAGESLGDTRFGALFFQKLRGKLYEPQGCGSCFAIID